MTTSRTPDAGRSARTVLVDQPFTESDLPALRRTVAAHADRTPLPAEKVRDLILIVSELASNAVRHGGGEGRLRLWTTAEAVFCEISDEGPGLPAAHPLPRQRPEPTVSGGRGLWLADQFADALTLAAGKDGGTVATASIRLV
jgi:anti-sigma regulatory factor (Ser/Thr protein kinase)